MVAGPIGAVVGGVVGAVGDTVALRVRWDLSSTRSLMICRAAAMSFELLSSVKFRAAVEKLSQFRSATSELLPLSMACANSSPQCQPIHVTHRIVSCS